MPTYKVEGRVTVSCWTEVEADSPEEAIKIATSRELAEHHIDGSYLEDEYWNFDNDGMPENLSAGQAGDAREGGGNG